MTTDSICDAFEAELRAGKRVRTEQILDRSKHADRTELLQALLEVELECLAADRKAPSIDQLHGRFPGDAAAVRAAYTAFRSRVPEHGVGTTPLSAAGTFVSGGALNSPKPRLPANFGHYILREALGQGGMGRVFRATDTQLNRDVALKLPFLDHSDEKQLERFRNEARAAATLDHPGICQIIHIDDVDGQPYLTMKLIDGQSLSDWLKSGKTVSVRRAASLIRRIAEAMVVAHAQNVIHRDLKPANIMLSEKGIPTVVDFGLAHQEMRSGDRITQAGATLGTPAYMPIEQAQGDIENINARSDIYSLGAILFRLLSGQPPYLGQPISIIGQIIAAKTPDLAKLNPELDDDIVRICNTAMAYKQEDRYGSMQEFADDLQDYLRSQGGSERGLAASTGAPQPAPPEDIAATASPAVSASRNGRRVSGRAAVFCGASLFGLLIWLAVVLLVKTEYGTLRIEVADPRIVVSVDGNEVTIRDRAKALQIEAGEKKLIIKSDALEFEVEKEFTLRISDGEKRLHVVLLPDGRPELRNGPMPNMSVESGQSDGSAVVLLQNDFDDPNDTGMASGQLPNAHQRIINGRYLKTTNQCSMNLMKGIGENVAPITGDIEIECVGRCIGSDSAQWGLAIEAFDESGNAKHGVWLQISNKGYLQLIPSGTAEDGNKPPRGKLLYHPAIRPAGEFNTVNASMRGGNRLSVAVNDHAIIWNQELPGKWDACRIGHEVRAKADGSISDRPVQLQLENIVVRRPSVERTEAERAAIKQQVDQTVAKSDPWSALNAIRSRLPDASPEQLERIRLDLVQFRRDFPGEEEAVIAGKLLESPTIRSLPDQFSLNHAPEYEIAALKKELRGADIPLDIVGIFGDSRLQHWNHVTAVACSPDGNRVVSGGLDATVRIWNSATEELIFLMHQHEQAVQTVAWSSDGRFIASADDQGIVLLWNAETGELMHRLKEHQLPVQALTFTRDNKFLASAGLEDRILIWEVDSGQISKCLGDNVSAESGGSCRSLISLPDGKTLFSAKRAGLYELWDLSSGERAKTWRGPWNVRGAALSPSGKLIVSGNDHRQITIWDLATGEQRAALTAKNNVTGVTFGRDDDTVYSTDESTHDNVTVWSLSQKIGRDVSGHVAPALCVAFNHSKSLLVSGGYAGRLRFWNANTGGEWSRRSAHDAMCNSARILPSGDVISGGRDNSVIRWDSAGRIMWRSMMGLNWQQDLDVAADGSVLCGGNSDASVHILDAADGSALYHSGPGGTANSVRWSPDGSKLAGIYAAHGLRVWDTASQRPLNEFSIPDIEGFATTWSPDSRFVAACGRRRDGHENVAYIFDAQTGQQVSTTAVGNSTAYKAHFHVDGHSLFIVTEEMLREVRVSDGQLLRSHVFSSQRGLSLDVSPSGRILAIAAADGNVQFLDTETLTKFHSVQIGGNRAWINDVSFSEDGRYLVASCVNGTAVILKTPTLTPNNRLTLTRRLAGDNAEPENVAFLGNDRILVSSAASARHLLDLSGKKIDSVKLAATGSILDVDGKNGVVGDPEGRLNRLTIENDTIKLSELTNLNAAIDGVQMNAGVVSATCRDGRVAILSSQQQHTPDFLPHPTSRPLSTLLLGDGRVVTGDDSGTARLWKNGKLALSDRFHIDCDANVFTMCHQPGRPWFAAVDYGDGTADKFRFPQVSVRDCDTLRPIHSFSVPCQSVYECHLSNSGRYLAIVGCGVLYSGQWQPPGQFLCVYDLFDGKLVQQVEPNRHSVQKVDFSPDDSRIIVCTGSKITPLSLYELQESEPLPEGLDPLFERMVAQELLDVGCSLDIKYPGRDDRLYVTSREMIPNCAFWLDQINIWAHSTPSKTLIGQLQKLYRLTILNAPESGIQDADMVSIRGCQSLERLVLDNTLVTGSGVAILEGHPSLKHLNIRKTRTSDADLQSLGNIASLRELIIDETQITAKGIANLGNISSLHLLWMHHNHVTDDVAKPLANATQLQSLALWGTHVTAATLPPITELKSLKLLTLVETSIAPEQCHALSQLPGLRTLTLEKDIATNAELQRLQEAMPWCNIDVR